MMNRSQNGQAALILVLVMMVSSTIALSVIQRTVQELELSSTEEYASKALQAAEAGVEEGLRTLTSNDNATLQGANYNLTVTTAGTDGYLSDTDVATGNTVEIPLTGSATPPTSIDVYWTDTTDNDENPTAALDVIKYQKFSDTDYRVTHLAYDPDATRRADNNFLAPTTPGGTALSTTFAARITVTIDPEDQIIRIRPVYNRAKVGIVPLPAGTLLPTLQHRIVSTGQTDQGIVRKIEVVRDQPSLPQYFDFSLYSGGTLDQQN